MSRKILFRGKDKDNIWREGSLVEEIDDFKIYCIEPYGEDDGTDYWLAQYEVNPETVGQYTGFNEFNKPDGEKLFDNDVVYIAGFGNYVVQWPYLELIGLELIDATAGDIGKKLGNIIDNPELLEVGE